MINLPEQAQVSQEIQDKYQRTRNTFIREVKSNPKDRINVEIGDFKQEDFKPQFKFMRWNNEVNFSLRAEEHPAAKVRTDKDKIVYETPDYEVHMYDKPEVSEDGGFEFEWILPKKPNSNVLSTTIQTKGLNFFYQPALTQEEIDEGAERPENVEGSYAVYHKTKGGMNRADGMEYKTGKAFHIYRPKIKDANGNEVWGELNIDEQKGELTVTIDQTWLDNAVYPVVVDPTFGYTSVPASWTFGHMGYDNLGDVYARSGNVYTGTAGTLDSITAYIRSDYTGNFDVKFALNEKDSGGSGTHAEIASAESLAVTKTAGWRTINMASQSISSVDYLINATSDVTAAGFGSGERADISFDSVSVTWAKEESGSDKYTTLEDPWTVSTSTQNISYGIYATYTADSPGSTRQFYYAEADAETSDMAADYSKQQTTLTFTPDDNSTYFILASWQMQQLTSTIRYIAGRLRNTTTPTVFQEYLEENHDNTEDYMARGALGIDTFTTGHGSQTYAIEYKGENTAVAAKCKNARIIALKKDAADEYAESTGNSTTTSATPQDKTTLTFTPSSAGRYIIFAAAGLDSTSASMDMGCMLDIDGTDYSVGAIRLVDTSTNRYGWSTVRTVDLTAASHTIKIQYNSDGAATVGIQDARIIALRADTFPDHYEVQADARATTTSTTYVDSPAGITITPNAFNYLVASSAIMDSSSAGETYRVQLVEGATQKWEELREVKATSNAMPTFGLYSDEYTATETTWKMQFRTESTATMGIDEIGLVVIQLDTAAVGGGAPVIGPFLTTNTSFWGG